MRQKLEQKKGFFQNINFQYTGRAENRIITTEDALFGPTMFDNAKTGMKHSIPLSTNFKIIKYLSLSTSVNYEEVWTQNMVKFNDYSAETQTVVKDTINKIGTFRQYSLSALVGNYSLRNCKFRRRKKNRIHPTPHFVLLLVILIVPALNNITTPIL